MLMVLSPAKNLDFTDPPLKAPATTPALGGDIVELAKTTRKLGVKDLQRLMSISDTLATLNRERFQAFDPACEDGLQAVFAFNGDVYQGLQGRSLDKPALKWAQGHLRILSGLYGVLRPLDLIQPYRLEMGIRLKTKRGASLYDFWGPCIAAALNEAVDGMKDPTLINLASQEYFGGVQTKALKVPLLTCHFKEVDDSGARTLSFYAKKARGLMARYAIDGRIDRPDGLKAFDIAGYAWNKSLSNETDWVFTRPFVPVAVARAAR